MPLRLCRHITCCLHTARARRCCCRYFEECFSPCVVSRMSRFFICQALFCRRFASVIRLMMRAPVAVILYGSQGVSYVTPELLFVVIVRRWQYQRARLMLLFYEYARAGYATRCKDMRRCHGGSTLLPRRQRRARVIDVTSPPVVRRRRSMLRVLRSRINAALERLAPLSLRALYTTATSAIWRKNGCAPPSIRHAARRYVVLH